MTDDGTGGDAVAGDGVFSATIPATIMTAGRMIRWRVRATDNSAYQTILPTYTDPIDSPQYFGTVPQDPVVQTQLMVVHRFIQNTSAAQTAAGTRASLYLNGEFYDNVGINLHGQSTSGGAFLKKSYDIDGNRGYRFKWSTDPAQPPAKDINLLTVYADKTKIRHDLAYEMNRAAGVAAHYCFLTHNRLNGTFDGLYSFVEDADDVYLTRAGLNPDGALYKMYNGMSNPATDAITGVEKKTRKLDSNFDLHQVLQGMHQPGTAAQRTFFFDNLDVPKMINFMAANTVTGNVDLHAKNYYIYCDTGKTNLWTLLPWDLDLSQGRLWTSANNYFDDGIYLNAGGTLSGQGQNLIAKLYAIPEFSAMARRRIRSLQDQFFSTRNAAPDLNRWYDRRVSEKAAEIGARIVSGQNDIPGSDAAAEAFNKSARDQGLATGEASLTSLAGMLSGKQSDANAYWRRIGADKSAPAAVVGRVRDDMNASARGLADLDKMAHSLIDTGDPARLDVAAFEGALIHARQARDSFSDALVQVNKHASAEYQITLELAPLDAALAAARATADDLAQARAEGASQTAGS
jgi:hypothetical protein